MACFPDTTNPVSRQLMTEEQYVDNAVNDGRVRPQFPNELILHGEKDGLLNHELQEVAENQKEEEGVESISSLTSMLNPRSIAKTLSHVVPGGNYVPDWAFDLLPESLKLGVIPAQPNPSSVYYILSQLKTLYHMFDYFSDQTWYQQYT